jgi:hypothetical protein
MPTSPRKRPRGGIWPTRRDLTGCYVRVHPLNEDAIAVAIPTVGDRCALHMLSRHEARMLARRINQCLDATVIR